MKKPQPKLMLGDLEVTSGLKDTPTRIALLLWGEQNVGKTSLAATAPGKKLWINLDPEGMQSVLHRDDVSVVDLTGMSNDDLFRKLQNDNPLSLDEFLAKNTEIETVVLDSATALAWKALEKAVKEGIGAGRGFTPSIMAPGISAYGGRNNIVIQCLSGLLKVTAKYNVHCIVTTHEDDPKTDEKGITLEVGMMLGGKTVKNFAWRLSEIWYMSLVNAASASDQTRRIAIRPTRLRKPMKTRIFDQMGAPEFRLQYDPSKPDEHKDNKHTLAKLFEAWVEGGGKKLPVAK